MDALDRTFQHLVDTIQARYPAYLSQSFDVAEIYQNILPYRHHRRELGLETNQDYELVLLQLFSGARDYLIVDEEMRERLARELASPNPDPGAFREFSTSQIALSPAAVRRFQKGGAPAPEPAMAAAGNGSATEVTQRIPAAPRPAAPAQAAPIAPPAPAAPKPASSTATAPSLVAQAAPRRAPVSAPSTTGPRAAAIPATSRGTQAIVPQAGETCRYCNGTLPPGRKITFCPHCGQNLTVVNCLACGTELELGWKFCTTCGRPVSQS
jgi:hypothetical protein